MKYRGGWPRLVQLFSRLRHRLWNTHHAAMRVKANMYCAIVIPTLLYGAETWTLYRRQEKHSASAFDHEDKLYGQCDKQGQTQTDRDAIYGRSSDHKEFPLHRVPKRFLYCQLYSGHRRRGCPSIRIKDTTKRNLTLTDVNSHSREINGEQLSSDGSRHCRIATDSMIMMTYVHMHSCMHACMHVLS